MDEDTRRTTAFANKKKEKKRLEKIAKSPPKWKPPTKGHRKRACVDDKPAQQKKVGRRAGPTERERPGAYVKPYVPYPRCSRCDSNDCECEPVYFSDEVWGYGWPETAHVQR